MTRNKRIREENLSAASSEQLGCNGPSMNASVNSGPGGVNTSNDCAGSLSTRGIDALSVGQSNIGQAFYQRRRKTKGISSAYVDVRDMTNVCVDCHALFWLQESKFIPRNGSPVYTGCCQEGRIRLPPVRLAPVFLKYLLDSTNGQKSVQFRNNIRSYNTMFALLQWELM